MMVSSNCYGCGACYHACEFAGIQMKINKHGFKYAEFNNDNCIKCNKCQLICNDKIESKQPLNIYALKNKNDDIRSNSSSGGFIYELSKHIIDNGGVVFGVCFTEDFKVKHMLIDNINDIYKMQGSKYTESDTGNTFEQVKEYLEKEINVLYTGTPCQINGLNKYLKGFNTEKLLTCDNVCHGVVSPLIFDKYKLMLEELYHSKLKNFTFRYKCGNRTQNIKAVFENESEYIGLNKQDDFYKIFFKNVGYRDSCYNCQFSDIKRISDITIGDFWGIEKSITGFDDGLGVSLLLNNTDKAIAIFKQIKDKFYVIESNTKDCLQPNLIAPTPEGYKNKIFWEKFEKTGFRKAVEALDE